MGISYRGLRELLLKYKIKNYEIKADTGLSNSVLVKINKDEYMQLDKLESILVYINQRSRARYGFGDIVELVDE